jgi:hypothetical protein
VELYDCLQHAYGDSEAITVLVDRRQGERRSLRSLADALRCQPSVRVRPHYRRSHD